MKEKIEAALNEIRPAIQRDGGDVEFVNVTDDKIVQVRLTGACKGCPMAEMTLRSGIERIIKAKVPEVAGVEAVN